MTIFRILFCLSILSSTTVFGQKIKEKDRLKFEKLSQEKDSLALDLALNIGDYDAAATLSFKLLVNDDKNIDKLFQLASIYFKAQQFGKTVNTCRQIVSIDSLNEKAFELAAQSYLNLKQNKNAIGVYQLMYSRFNNANYLYQIAVIQFQENEYEESLKTLSAIVNDSTALSVKIPISDKSKEGKITEQSITLTAAAYNVAGFIMLQQKSYEIAQKYFEEALKIAPDFIFANNNLRQAMVLAAEEKAKPTAEEQKKPEESKD